MCLRLEDSGALRFVGGFEYYNPAGWTYLAQTGELTFILPSLAFDTATVQALRSYVDRGSLKAFDRGEHSLRYQLHRYSASFDFLGWYFFRPDSLRAQGIELTTRCSAAKPRGQVPNSRLDQSSAQTASTRATAGALVTDKEELSLCGDVRVARRSTAER